MRSASQSHTHRKWIALALIILGIGMLARITYKKYQEYRAAKIQIEMQENILEGATAQPDVVKVDYAKQTGVGSPLVFGGSHSPPSSQPAIWDAYSDVGVTSMRKDLYVEFSLPRNITIVDYKANKNDIQNVKNWDMKTIDAVTTALTQAKAHNIKVIGIMGYAPHWLTYNDTPFGVPKDWDVFESIVKKIYTLYRDDLDYVEVWNEPDHRIFLVTDKSNMSKEEAYVQIYNHTVKAIQSVDAEINDGKKVIIGGPAESNAKISKIFEHLLTSPELVMKPQFISFHAYDNPLYESSLERYRGFDQKYLGGNTPIFVTEWNNETRNALAAQYKTGDLALSFVGDRFITYLNDGITGANYFSLLPINSKDRGTPENSMGFYRYIDNKVDLLPQAKAWKLMSKTLSLGKGPSTIMASDFPDSINAVGGINSNDEEVVAIANTSDNPQLLELQLKNLNVKKRARVYVYLASKEYNGTKPVRSELAEIKKSVLKTRFYMPEQSVAGIIVKQFNDTWFDFFDGITNTK